MEDQPTFDMDSYRWCFACGSENPHGLHLKFEHVAGEAVAEFVPEKRHQGWDGLVHGGIIFTLLDEALAYAAIFASGRPAVTAEMQARIRKPCPVGQVLTATGRMTKQKLGVVLGEAKLTGPNGELYADGTGKFLLLKNQIFDVGGPDDQTSGRGPAG